MLFQDETEPQDTALKKNNEADSDSESEAGDLDSGAIKRK